MHTLRPRGYQTEALAAVADELTRVNRTAVVLPTGMGKTVVFSHLIAGQAKEGKRVLVLVHRDELAEQAKDKLHSVAPDLSIGIVKAERNEVDADVVVASVQTLARAARREQITGIGMVVVDECHHALARTWREVLTHFGCYGVDDSYMTPDGPVIDMWKTPTVGFTATLARGDGLGLGDVWESVAYEKDIEWGIEHGYLCDPRGYSITVDGFDLAQIAKSRGDYAEGKLGDALEAVNAGPVVAESYLEHAGKRRGIIFAPTVSSAQHFADSFTEAGIVTEMIDGTTPKEDRELIYKRFQHGDTQVLANCMVLTEGFDAPWAEVAVIARPTQSAPLYTQMVGRVLRLFPGKDDALVLDVVGIAGQHKLRTLKNLTKVPTNEGESIAEATERLAVEREEVLKGEKLKGERKAAAVEMFSSSRSVWLQTKGGTWFIPVRGGAVVLFSPDGGGHFSVGRKMDRQSGEWLYKGVTSLEAAMAWGEQLADEMDPTLANKDRAWRRAKPSQAQLDLAIRMKLAPVEELEAMRRGALSDLLSVHFASRSLKALDSAAAEQLRKLVA